ncbi:hypothetical protein M427DRAFT_55024 [Gonapodya prolifera JEL478]|uniref:PX domain-containing protein n=1 Tax=Gonapodya prolifera (strain JEL478) TaxID=1344416 RepID=A0A139AJP3_GONPJ|nr:hypothetical protein M427DRAFT_55024 [Gonapodya prolifera JEL478]|eukprot:KXS17002.1 hypothetical protein M427DRAFT_55024 [Gonapodya prolifera JEL478]
MTARVVSPVSLSALTSASSLAPAADAAYFASPSELAVISVTERTRTPTPRDTTTHSNRVSLARSLSPDESLLGPGFLDGRVKKRTPTGASSFYASLSLRHSYPQTEEFQMFTAEPVHPDWDEDSGDDTETGAFHPYTHRKSTGANSLESSHNGGVDAGNISSSTSTAADYRDRSRLLRMSSTVSAISAVSAVSGISNADTVSEYDDSHGSERHSEKSADIDYSPHVKRMTTTENMSAFLTAISTYTQNMPRSRSVNVIPATSNTAAKPSHIRDSHDSFTAFSERNLGHGRRSSDSHLHAQRALVSYPTLASAVGSGFGQGQTDKPTQFTPSRHGQPIDSRPPSGVFASATSSEISDTSKPSISSRPVQRTVGTSSSDPPRRRIPSSPFERFKLKANGLRRNPRVALPSLDSLPQKYHKLGVAAIVTDPVTILADGRVVDDPGFWTVFSRAVTVYKVVVMLLRPNVPHYRNSEPCILVVNKRYSDFLDLHRDIQNAYYNPPKSKNSLSRSYSFQPTPTGRTTPRPGTPHAVAGHSTLPPLPSLPIKDFFTRYTPAIIDARRKVFQDMLDVLVQDPVLYGCPQLLEFCGLGNPVAGDNLALPHGLGSRSGTSSGGVVQYEE